MIHCPSSLFSSSNTTLQIRTSGQLVCGKKAPPSSISSTYHIAKKAVHQESNYSFSTVTLLYLYYYAMLQPLSVTVLPSLLHHVYSLLLFLFSYLYYTMLEPFFSVTVLPLLLHHATASLSPFFLSSILIQQETI